MTRGSTRVGINAAWCLVQFILLAAFSFATAEPKRTAALLGGSLITTRSPLLTNHQSGLGSRRLLHAEEPELPSVFVVGLPPSKQSHVYCTLKEHAAHLLHPLAGHGSSSKDAHHHWIVSATDSAISALLDSHTEATAARMPAELKTAPAVQAVMAEPPTTEAGNVVLTLMALVSGVTPEQLSALVQQARVELAPLLPLANREPACGMQVEGSSSFLMVSVCQQDMAVAVPWLAAHPRVSWVDLRQRLRLHNLATSAVLQAPERMAGAALPGSLVTGGASSMFPLWKAGLTGEGQVVGHVDSGVDMDSRYFSDPKVKDLMASGSSSTTTIDPAPFGKADDPFEYLEDAHRRTLANKLVFRDPGHRKVVLYVGFGDERDYDGHGTFTAGTIAGSASGFDPLTAPDMGTGVAPGAKLAVFDLGQHTLEDGAPAFADADPGVFYGLQHQAGARVTSNSWGVDGQHNYSAPTCFMLDAATWAQQDTLHVFAAGNDGTRLDLWRGTGSVVAPATCKNVVAVGATESWVDEGLTTRTVDLIDAAGKQVDLDLSGFTAPKPALDYSVTFVAGDGSFNRSLVPYGVWAPTSYVAMTGSDADTPAANWADEEEEVGSPDRSFNSGFAPLRAKDKVKLVIANPENACEKLVGSYAPPDAGTAVVVLVRGTLDAQGCPGATALDHVVAAGASGMVLFYDDTLQLVRSGSAAFAGRTFPAWTIRPELGWELAATLTGEPPAGVTIQFAPLPTAPSPIDNVAWFSSFGSGADTTTAPDTDYSEVDARIKPDLVAPGYALSAASDQDFTGVVDKCAVAASQGTSVAAPVVAGAAALVRQYFVQGFYPSGAASDADSHDPSGPLVKAVLLAGAAAMKGVSRVNGERLAPPPSPFQGYGRVDASASLPLAGNADGVRLQVVDGATFTADGVDHVYNISVPAAAAGLPLDMVLAYFDFPAFPGSKYVLVNDLDLVVTDPSGTQLWGNGKEGGDYLNNNEKVTIGKTTAGQYKIAVRASYLFIAARPQPYALVVRGAFDGSLGSNANPAAR